jgi:hypothetical protein
MAGADLAAENAAAEAWIRQALGLEPVNDFGREAVCSGYEQETIPE